MSLPQSEDVLRQLAVDEVGMKLLRAAELKRARPSLHCALTAVSDACNGQSNKTFNPTWARFMAVNGFNTSFEVYAWHDAPERTADEVIEALTQAAFRRE